MAWWVDCGCFDWISSYVIVHIDCDTIQALSTIQAKLHDCCLDYLGHCGLSLKI